MSLRFEERVTRSVPGLEQTRHLGAAGVAGAGELYCDRGGGLDASDTTDIFPEESESKYGDRGVAGAETVRTEEVSELERLESEALDLLNNPIMAEV